jgi:hypothetical protein
MEKNVLWIVVHRPTNRRVEEVLLRDHKELRDESFGYFVRYKTLRCHKLFFCFLAINAR